MSYRNYDTLLLTEKGQTVEKVQKKLGFFFFM